jgi:hypothetical protein
MPSLFIVAFISGFALGSVVTLLVVAMFNGSRKR